MKRTFKSLTLTKVSKEHLHIKEGFYLQKNLRNGQVMNTNLSLLGKKPRTFQPLEWQMHLQRREASSGFSTALGKCYSKPFHSIALTLQLLIMRSVTQLLWQTQVFCP